VAVAAVKTLEMALNIVGASSLFNDERDSRREDVGPLLPAAPRGTATIGAAEAG
jgi:hypothetical protein